MTSTQDSEWLEDLLHEFAGCGWKTDKPHPRYMSCEWQDNMPEAIAKIRQHMLSEALVLIGEDDNEVRGTTQSPDNPNYWTKRTKHRNEIKAELMQAFTEKYGERE